MHERGQGKRSKVERTSAQLDDLSAHDLDPLADVPQLLALRRTERALVARPRHLTARRAVEHAQIKAKGEVDVELVPAGRNGEVGRDRNEVRRPVARASWAVECGERLRVDVVGRVVARDRDEAGREDGLREAARGDVGVERLARGDEVLKRCRFCAHESRSQLTFTERSGGKRATHL